MLQSWVIIGNSSDCSEAKLSCCELTQIPEYVRMTQEYISQAAALQSQAERTSLLVSSATFIRINSDRIIVVSKAFGL